MKQRSTTPVSKRLVTKSIVVATAVMMVLAAPLAMMPNVFARDYQGEIDALEREAAEYNQQASELGKKADSLQQEVNRINAEKNAIQTKVELSQTKYEKLVADIKANEKKIEDNRNALGTTIADMYVDDTITPLEMLASSSNIGDYVDKQTYRSSISDKLQETIDAINRLKKELEKQKVSVERVLNDLKRQKEALASKETERQQLLAKTKSDKNAYQELSSQREAQIAQVREAYRQAFAPLRNNPGSSSPTGFAITYKNWSGNVYCGGGYPSKYCAQPLDAYVADDWGLHLAGECVHYTAWALANRGYYIPYNAFSMGNGYGGGSANKWVPAATGEGFASIVNNPAANARQDDLVYMAVPGVGHVGIVEQNYGNGWVKISQYNFAVYDGVPKYSTMDLKVDSATTFLRFRR